MAVVHMANTDDPHCLILDSNKENSDYSLEHQMIILSIKRQQDDEYICRLSRPAPNITINVVPSLPQQGPHTVDCGAFMYAFMKHIVYQQQPDDPGSLTFRRYFSGESTRGLMIFDLLHGFSDYVKQAKNTASVISPLSLSSVGTKSEKLVTSTRGSDIQDQAPNSCTSGTDSSYVHQQPCIWSEPCSIPNEPPSVSEEEEQCTQKQAGNMGLTAANQPIVPAIEQRVFLSRSHEANEPWAWNISASRVGCSEGIDPPDTHQTGDTEQV